MQEGSFGKTCSGWSKTHSSSLFRQCGLCIRLLASIKHDPWDAQMARRLSLRQAIYLLVVPSSSTPTPWTVGRENSSLPPQNEGRNEKRKLDKLKAVTLTCTANLSSSKGEWMAAACTHMCFLLFAGDQCVQFSLKTYQHALRQKAIL